MPIKGVTPIGSTMLCRSIITTSAEACQAEGAGRRGQKGPALSRVADPPPRVVHRRVGRRTSDSPTNCGAVSEGSRRTYTATQRLAGRGIPLVHRLRGRLIMTYLRCGGQRQPCLVHQAPSWPLRLQDRPFFRAVGKKHGRRSLWSSWPGLSSDRGSVRRVATVHDSLWAEDPNRVRRRMGSVSAL